MADVVLGLGANLGSRMHTLGAALELLEAKGDVAVVARSRVYATPPVGPPQPTYLNAAALVRTSLTLPRLLERALSVERALGRVRRERWGPRLIDLDLLWADEAVRIEGLEVPHPRLRERSFALAPLLDVLPGAPAELSERLDLLGGAPEVHRGRLGETPGHAQPSGGGWTATCRAGDAPDAWAGALTALARAAAGPTPPAAVETAAGGPSTALSRLTAALSAGFRPRWVLVEDADAASLRLVGARGAPLPLEPRHAETSWSEEGATVRLAAARESSK